MGFKGSRVRIPPSRPLNLKDSKGLRRRRHRRLSRYWLQLGDRPTRLAPFCDGAKALKDDYARMVEDGLLFDDAEPFEALMARCADIAARTNSAGK